MASLWTLGGLTWYELLRRASKESWHDEVFGQAARLSFYHFLAIVPSLLLAVAMLRHFASGPGMQDTLSAALDGVLPDQAAELVSKLIGEMSLRVMSVPVFIAALGCAWASLNGTWAMVVGLNKAYEVEDRRSWWRLLAVITGLTIALAVLALLAVALILYGSRLGQSLAGRAGFHPAFGLIWTAVRWPVIVGLLLAALSLLYRFAPDLSDLDLRWSTPGALVGAVLWLGSALVFRAWVRHSASYGQLYGSLAGVVVLLLFFYLTAASVLIGGEVNSEIEKAVMGSHRQPRHESPGNDHQPQPAR